MTRKFQIVLMTALTTVALASLAAPPRFSGYSGLQIVENESEINDSSAPEAVIIPKATARAEQIEPVKPQESKPANEAQPAEEPQANKPSMDSAAEDTKAQEEKDEMPVEVARPTAKSPIDNRVGKSTSASVSWSEFWKKLLNKGKQSALDEKTFKKPDQLVNTNDHHKNANQLLEQGDLHRFYSGYKSFWKVESSKVMCSMRQEIPDYGYVEFRQGVGQPLEFALYVTHPPAGVGKAHLRTEPPPWQHYVQAKDLGIIEVDPGERAVIATANWSRRLLMELAEGMQPRMRYWDSADSTDDIEVILSAINFHASLQQFHRCLENILRYDFLQVQRTLVSFNPDSSRLTKTAINKMDEVLEILQHDKDIKRVELELYTHRKGLVQYNFRLATRRARAIRDYFLSKGIGENKLIIKIHTHSKEKLQKLGYNIHDVHILLVREDK